MEPAPAPSLKVSQTDLLLEFLIIPLNAPAQFRQINKIRQDGVGRQGREPVLGRPLLALGPFDQAPLLRPHSRAPVVAVSRPHPHGGKARGQRGLGALTPSDACQALSGRAFANFWAETGLCCGSRRRSVGGRPRPLQGFGGRGPVPGAQRLVLDCNAHDIGQAHSVSAVRNAVSEP